MKKHLATVAALAALFVSGCLLPQDFRAELAVAENGAYTFAYEGTVLYLVSREERENGRLKEEDEESGAAEVIEMLGDHEDVVEIAYQGNDIFKLALKASGNVTEEPMSVLDERGIFAFAMDEDGETCTFAFLESDPDDLPDDEVKQLFESMQGAVVITTALPVEKTGGNPTVSEDGKTYTWKVSGLTDDMPKLVMRVKK